jgi:hypothetical protein
MTTMTAHTITEYGASGDETVETDAIQSAIDACADAGGGTVAVPPGTYVTGTLELQSHVTLRLSPGAVLRGSPDPSDYGGSTHSTRQDDGEPSSGSPDDPRPRALLCARDASDVSIVGRGTIDGHASAFVHDRVLDPANDPAIESDWREHAARQGESFMDPDVWPSEDGPLAFREDRPRQVLMIDGCRSVTLRDVSIRGAPAWTVRLRDCEGVTVRDVEIRNDRRVPNSDGVVPESSRNVHIAGCTITTGDDAITPKAHAEYGPCENVTVTGCTLASRSGALKIGTETGADVRDVLVSNVVVRDTNRALGIQHRGSGDVERICFSNVTVETRLHTGNWWGTGEPIHVSSLRHREGEDLGAVRDVRFENVVARGEGGVVLWAGPAGTIENLTIDGLDLRATDSEYAGAVGGNVDLRSTATRTPLFEHDVPGVYCRGVDGLTLRDVDVRWEGPLPSYHTHGVHCATCAGVEIDGVSARQAGTDGAAIYLEGVEGPTIRDSTGAPGTDTFLALEGTTDERLLVDNDLTAAREPIAGDASGFERFGNAGLD